MRHVGHWSDAGVTYVEPWGRWLVAMKTVEDGVIWAVIDPTTWIAERAADLGGAVKPSSRLENKIRYFESAGAVVWIHRADQDIRVLRVL